MGWNIPIGRFEWRLGRYVVSARGCNDLILLNSRACGAYLEVCSSMPGDNAKTAGALLDLVMALTEVKDPRVVETTVTTVGKMGR